MIHEGIGGSVCRGLFQEASDCLQSSTKLPLNQEPNPIMLR